METVQSPATVTSQRGRLRRAGVAARQVVLVVASASALLPLYAMLTAAFKGQNDYLAHPLGLPLSPSGAAFSTALSSGFPHWLLNSILVAGASVLISLMLATLAAYAFSRMPFPGRSVSFTLMISLMVVPPIVMLIPLFELMSDLNLVNTYQSVIIIYAGLMLPFSIYLLTSFFNTIPRELLEAGSIDGAGHFRSLISIILPLAMPALVTLGIVNLLWAWNELLIALVLLQDDSMKTLMVGITIFQSHNNLNVPVTMAGLLIATIPIVVIYLAGQRFFVQGLAAGAVKE
ncbi:MAG: binding-protein-dependent transport system inner rane component [Chloroflexi bacterium]|nr:binding-protein-dependent transport system inner rane component [Chloroflexota bacterium]